MPVTTNIRYMTDTNTTTTTTTAIDKTDRIFIGGIMLYIIGCAIFLYCVIKNYWLIAIDKGHIHNQTGELCMAAAAGLLGSLLFISGSLAFHVGTKGFKRSWTVWYLLHPITGIGLALMAYFAIKAKIIGSDMGIYGILVLCTLFGMFSTEANNFFKSLFSKLTSSTNTTTQGAKPNTNNANTTTTKPDYKTLSADEQSEIAGKAAEVIKADNGSNNSLAEVSVADGTDTNINRKVILLVAITKAKITDLSAIGDVYEYEGYKIPVEKTDKETIEGQV
jgi:hypothetical protein